MISFGIDFAGDIIFREILVPKVISNHMIIISAIYNTTTNAGKVIVFKLSLTDFHSNFGNTNVVFAKECQNYSEVVKLYNKIVKDYKSKYKKPKPKILKVY